MFRLYLTLDVTDNMTEAPGTDGPRNHGLLEAVTYMPGGI